MIGVLTSPESLSYVHFITVIYMYVNLHLKVELRNKFISFKNLEDGSMWFHLPTNVVVQIPDYGLSVEKTAG